MLNVMINFLKKAIQQLFCLLFIVSIVFLMSSSPILASQDNGAAIFEANCAGCHPRGGNIIRRGKNLQERALKRNHFDTIDAIASLVKNGKNNMPAYEERLDSQEIETVSNYVLQQAGKHWRN